MILKKEKEIWFRDNIKLLLYVIFSENKEFYKWINVFYWSKWWKKIKFIIKGLV